MVNLALGRRVFPLGILVIALTGCPPVSYELTINVTGNGSVSPAGGAYAADETVELHATPDTGWRFVRWEGDLTGSANPATIVMDSDKIITAVFTEDSAETGFDFYAMYARIIDEERHGVNLYNCEVDMCKDGSMLAGYAYDDDNNYYAYMTDFLGLSDRFWTLPATRSGPGCVAISPDGTTAYVAAAHEHESDMYPVLFKLVDETMTRLDVLMAIPQGVTSASVMHTNANGSDVYFRDGVHHHIWTVDHNGMNLCEVIDPDDYVELDGTRGLWISDFDLNDGAGRVAFIMERWVPPPGQGSFDIQHDIIAWRASTQFTRMTADSDPEISKGSVYITPDGLAVLYVSFGSAWYVADFAGASTAVPNLTPSGAAVGDGDLSTIFWSNTSFSYSGGCIISCDGTGKRDLFAGTGLDADGGLNMSSGGNIIAFKHRYKSYPHTEALYVGYLDTVDDLTDAPDIEWIAFSQPGIARDDPDDEVVVTAKVSDDDGLGVIDAVGRAVLRGGTSFAYGEAPVSLTRPSDTGSGPDAVAGDGIYSCLARPTSAMRAFAGNEVTVRIGVEDDSGNAVVGDVLLPILH